MKSREDGKNTLNYCWKWKMIKKAKWDRWYRRTDGTNINPGCENCFGENEEWEGIRQSDVSVESWEKERYGFCMYWKPFGVQEECRMTDRKARLLLYKSKGDILECGNFRRIKFTEHMFKVLEWIVDKRLREIVDISNTQLGFMSGKGTVDAIYITQLQD